MIYDQNFFVRIRKLLWGIICVYCALFWSNLSLVVINSINKVLNIDIEIGASFNFEEAQSLGSL